MFTQPLKANLTMLALGLCILVMWVSLASVSAVVRILGRMVR